MKIVFLGPPGCGKGTQAKVLGEKFGLVHVSTGDLFRANIAAGTELGKKAKGFMDAGQLVPDTITLQMFQDRVSKPDCQKGYILDGFPRTVPQAQALTKMLCEQSDALSHVIFFELTEAELTKRLAHRRGTESRADDTAEVQLERLRVYQVQTAPLVDYYRQLGVLTTVDASGAIPEVQQNLVRALGLQQ